MRKSVSLLVVCASILSILPSSDGEEIHPQPADVVSSSRDAIDQMLRGIEENPGRKALLFSERYYIEEFSCSGPALPYRGYRRLTVSQENIEGADRIVVNEQFILPPGNSVGGLDYHGAHYEEFQLTFNEEWQVTEVQHWHWGREDRTKETFRFGFKSGWAGYFRLNISKDKIVASADGRYPYSYPAHSMIWNDRVNYLDGKNTRTLTRQRSGLPSASAARLLLPLAADYIKGKTLHTEATQSGKRRTYSIDEVEQVLSVAPSADVPGIRGSIAVSGTVVAVDNGINTIECIPSIGEFREVNIIASWSYRRCSRTRYVKELKNFAEMMGIEELTDTAGKIVPLPLGLSIFKEDD